MIIPKFEEKTIAIYEMEFEINEEASEEEKQFKRILAAIKDFQRLPTVEEITAILEYESKALDYGFKLAINTLDKRGFEKNYIDIYNAVNDVDFYPKALKEQILYIKYCTLQKTLGELSVIWDIKEAVRELTFRYNNYDRELLQAITDSKQ